ncbi:alkaline phosphatase D family protein [Congregibacter sp.]|uniref:alkaline phosphatase D family protein n=1 Tax=Congregibacter sp. TaxID=2744308 RepID=UPI003F6CD274
MSNKPVFKRRNVIKGMAATLGVLSLRGFSVNGEEPVYFTHGIASGDPLSDRVILWTRVLPGDGKPGPLAVGWEIAKDAQFKTVVNKGTAVTSEQRDYTVKVDATGLKPKETYFYRFNARGAFSPVGRTRTLPMGAVDAFTMAVCSCSNFPQGYFNAYRDIADSEVDVVLHLGDYIYEYADGVYSNPVAVEELGRRVEPASELLRLEDYRMRYGLYRTDADLQAAHAAHPWICVWDDHELMNDTWKGGAENHNEGEGDFATRIAAARKVYHEWMPIRTGAEGDQAPIFRQFPVGDLADIVMLDTRLHGRDKQFDYSADIEAAGGLEAFIENVLWDPERTILGADQEAWLTDQLAASKSRGATWQVIGQQVIMGRVVIPEIPPEALDGIDVPVRTRRWFEAMGQLAAAKMPWNMDAWNGYPANRERVFSAMLEHANNPLVLAGDTHNAWTLNLSDKAGTAVGVEVGVPGISSPGLETYLPLPPAEMSSALLASSPELIDVDTSRRGWTEVTLTPEAIVSQHRFLSTVLSKDFSIDLGPKQRCEKGQKRFA